MENLGQSKANILIVDDDVLIAESTKFQLRKANYQTIGTAFTANEAIQIAKDKNPDLILMDVNLGGNVDGISAAGEIQEFADIPFIFVTAYSDNATIERAKKIGPFGYLIKPYNERELLVAIETSLYKHSFDKKIKEQELLFRTVANFAYEWEYWLLPDLKFKYCSPSCKRVTGYTSEEFISDPKLLLDIVHPDDRKNFEEHIRDYYPERRDEHFQAYEFRIIDKQGNQKFLSHSCSAINDDISNYRGRRVTNIDITEKKKAQIELEEYKKHLEDLVEERTAELEASTERFRYLAENSKDSIFRIDNKFVIQYMNASMKERLDIKERENLLEVLVINKASKSLRNLIEGTLQETFEAKVVVRKQIFHTNKFWMDWVFIPEVNTFNEVETILGFGRDITEIKQLQEKIQEAFEKGKELNELKTNFISFASHEFRTPLTTIQTSADLLKLFGRKWSKEKYNKHFSQIETAIDEITHMLEQVLTISRVERRKQSFNPEQTNIKNLIDEIIAGINILPYFKHIISTKYVIKREESYIDSKLVKSILRNLISNAVKYSPKAKRIEFEVIQEENSLLFEIEDHGIGIPENEINKIFEPFHRASNIGTTEGTGLGLAIVRQMVELHNGTISVYSKINEGTKFRVIISTKVSASI